MHPRLLIGIVLLLGAAGLALVPGSLPGQNPVPARPANAAWAMSGTETPAPVSTSPQVIATTRNGRPPLPAESRLPLPDDGLRPPPSPSPAARTGPIPPVPPVVPVPVSPTPPAPPPSPADGMIQRTAYIPGEKPSGPDARSPGSLDPVPAARSALALDVVGPVTAVPGQILPCQVIVRNVGNLVLSGVRVELPIPAGVRLVACLPEPERDGDRLVWLLGNLAVGGSNALKLEVQVTHPGELHLCPAGRFTAPVGLRTSIVRPAFAATITGPESAQVSEKVIFQIQIGNHGTQPIRRVGLRCELSAGLLHPQGQIIETELPEDLLPGHVRSISLEAQSRKPGRHTATLSATAEGNQTAQATASLLIQEPTLSLTVNGPRQGSVGQTLDFQVEVANPGRNPSPSLRLSQTLPEGLEYVSASTGGQYSVTTQAITWNLGELQSEQRQTVTYQVRAKQTGDWALAASVGGDGLGAVRRTHAIQVQTAPTLSLELTAQDDPVAIGQETNYELRVYNPGSVVARGLRLVLQVPDNLLPVLAEGPVAWQIRGQQVVFEPMVEMRPRVDGVYRVRVRGVRPGQGRFRADLQAGGLSKPLHQELTSHVTGGTTSASLPH